MAYKVVVPCVLAKDQQGYVFHKYEGAVIEWLSPDQEKRFVSEGLVEKIGSHSKPKADEDDQVTDGDPEGKPLHAAPKAAWVDYAVSQGADPDEAEATNKADLIALYGGE